MCGIVGVLNLTDHPPVEETILYRMLGMLRHRGPDGLGIYRDAHVGLGNARLSIIDLISGQQPIGNEDGTLWIVCNGEIFNYIELRAELEARGHRFATNTDVEVIVHLYEDHGPACLDQLNGQFAIALWDVHNRSLFLARDRLGIRPLFYTVNDGRLVFGSEIKAILAYPDILAEIDPISLQQIFTFWSPLSPRTAFQNIAEIPAGHYLMCREGQWNIFPYWELDFAQDDSTTRTPQEYLDEFECLLTDASHIRLRADVPVGAYLSGGLDSSVTSAIIRTHVGDRLDTFSIAFDDTEYDESQFQGQMAGYLGTDHRVVHCAHEDIGAAFPDVVWHTEMPILRTAPVPMYLLSKLVHEHNLKVVLTGEGADECLAGYNVFKEMKVRRFWARRPESPMRPRLLERLYPYITNLASSGAYLTTFFRKGLSDTDSPFYSHAIRWTNTSRARRFLEQKPKGLHRWYDEYHEQIPLPAAFSEWSSLAQAQYLEMTIFLSQYLLCSQGDRMAMAHSVEGRFPFLDHRVVEFCNRLPPKLKLRGLTEKWLLKQLGRKLVPVEIWKRPKRPYRAPIRRSFFDGGRTPDYVREILSASSLREAGLFNPGAVEHLVRKANADLPFSEVEDMALAGILSTQLVYDRFVKSFRTSPLAVSDTVKIVDRVEMSQATMSRVIA